MPVLIEPTENQVYLSVTKGQLISKCPYEKPVLFARRQTLFCTSLEVVNFKNKNLGNIFVAIFVQTDFS